MGGEADKELQLVGGMVRGRQVELQGTVGEEIRAPSALHATEMGTVVQKLVPRRAPWWRRLGLGHLKEPRTLIAQLFIEHIAQGATLATNESLGKKGPLACGT